MSFSLEITIENFLRILSQQEPSVIVTGLSENLKQQQARICFDSREIQEGEIFWALVGKNFDPHKGGIVEKAFNKGAIMAVINQTEAETLSISAYASVSDTNNALLRFAQGYRKEFPEIKIVGITGSAGKTSTKEMVSAVLKQSYNTLVTKGNLNNLFGVPMTLLGLTKEHQAAVIEMGTNAPGEISKLSKTALPDIAVITNVGYAHLEGLGSLEGVFNEKISIKDGFGKKGSLVVNADDQMLSKVRSTAKCKVYTFGIKRGMVCPDEIKWENGCANFRISRTWFKLKTPGLHNLYNALAAVAVGELMRIPKNKISEALESVDAYNMRSQICEGNGITIISDCYNANPTSTKISIETMFKIPTKGKRIAILGDMGELGEHSTQLHKDTGNFLAEMSVDFLVAIGEKAHFYCEGAKESGMKSSCIKYFSDKESAFSFIENTICRGDLILVKASRFMQFENIVKFLLQLEPVSNNMSKE